VSQCFEGKLVLNGVGQAMYQHRAELLVEVDLTVAAVQPKSGPYPTTIGIGNRVLAQALLERIIRHHTRSLYAWR
jgi:hypothetical protein